MRKPFPSKPSENSHNQIPPSSNNNYKKSSSQSSINNIKIEYFSSEAQSKSVLNPSDFISTSSESIPQNEYLIKNTGIPFGINITPFPDIDNSLIPQYSFGGGNGKIPRCKKCKSFYNSFCQLDNYTSYKCNICSNLNDLNNIDIETLKKLENNNTEIYEFFANSDYIENSPMSSNFVFILDVTNKSINSGAVNTFIESLRSIINNHYFINEQRTFISFITFNYTGVSFYKINNKNNSIQIYEIGGDEPFIPENKKSLIYSIDDNFEIINTILDTLDTMYSVNNSNNKVNNEYETENLIFAIECGKMLLQNKGGKLIVVNSSINWKNKIDFYQKINKLNNNANKSLLNNLGINTNNNNKNKEEDDPFIMIGKALTKYQISCDIFQLQMKNEQQNNQILINICNYCNGNFYFYKNFNTQVHYKNFFNSLIKCITNQKAYEIIMQFYISPIVDIKHQLSVIPAQIDNSLLFPCIDLNQTFSFILQYKEFKSKENQELINNTSAIGNNFNMNNNHNNEENINDIYIQFGIIYTSLEGTRIIRVINKKISRCNDKLEYIKNINIEAVCCIMTKFLIYLMKQSSNIFNAVAEYKYKYFIYALSIFKNINLDELLTSFLLCYLGIMKNKFFCLEPQKYKLNNEEIIAGKNKLLKMKIDDILNIIVPKIYDITNILNNSDTFDNVCYQPINLSKNSIQNDKVYLIDNGIFLNFYFTEGENNSKRLKIFFGEDMDFSNVGTFYHSESSVFEENENRDDFEVEKCKEIIDIIRNNKKSTFLDIFFSFSKSPSEALIRQCLLLDNCCPWYQFSYKDTFNKL